MEASATINDEHRQQGYSHLSVANMAHSMREGPRMRPPGDTPGALFVPTGGLPGERRRDHPCHSCAPEVGWRGMALQSGARFGRYELLSRLGGGGMAETYRARLLGEAGVTKPVLIKKVLPEYATDEAFTSMFISEARISATLSHANIAQVYDFGRVDDEYFLAMEFVDGHPLHHLLQRAMQSGFAA